MIRTAERMARQLVLVQQLEALAEVESAAEQSRRPLACGAYAAGVSIVDSARASGCWWQTVRREGGGEEQ